MFIQSKLIAFPFVLVMATCVIGCGSEIDTSVYEDVEGEVDSLEWSPEDPSTQSVVLPNSLSPLALRPSDLGVHPLSISGMSVTTAALVKGPDGTLVRSLLKYAVGCALGARARFDFSWIDATGTMHNESYAGSAGYAPEWPNRALDVAEQEWVSACLAARTNRYGDVVNISMGGRLLPLDANNNGETNSYPNREGKFWGNLFSPTPFLRACYDSDNVANSRLHHRDCATGRLENGTVLECGMIVIVGSCQQTCLSSNNGGYYLGCGVVPGAIPGQTLSHRPVTVSLP